MANNDFDPAVLRSFVLGIDLGSFAKAAQRVGRSTSAVSAQIHKLEEQAGVPLLTKSGRGLTLTEPGERMLGYARRLIELNDEAALAVRGVELEGWIRIGMQEDFGGVALPDVLGRFARAYPKVRIEAHVAGNTELLARIDADKLDLALVWDHGLPMPLGWRITAVEAQQMCWVGASAIPWSRNDRVPLPLAALDRPCQFHTAAMDALDRAQIPWRVAFTSPSLAGLWAAAAAGLGLVVRTGHGLPASVMALDPVACGLPALPTIRCGLLHGRAPMTPVVERLAAIVIEARRVLAPGPGWMTAERGGDCGGAVPSL